MKPPKAKPNPSTEPDKPLPPEGANAFPPRKCICTDPAHPNPPRQTLINSAAPLEPPKILPSLPNIVQLQQLPGPARPRLQISRETLSKLRPRELRKVKMTTAPAPDLPTLDQKLADIAPSMLPNAPARPKLELNAGGAPPPPGPAQTGALPPPRPCRPPPPPAQKGTGTPPELPPPRRAGTLVNTTMHQRPGPPRRASRPERRPGERRLVVRARVPQLARVRRGAELRRRSDV